MDLGGFQTAPANKSTYFVRDKTFPQGKPLQPFKQLKGKTVFLALGVQLFPLGGIL